MSSAHDAAVPVPPEISCVVDPLFELLTAFPVPQLLATLESRHCAASPRSLPTGLNDKDDENIASAFLHSARTLMASSSYKMLRQVSLLEDEGDEKKNLQGVSPFAQRIHDRLRFVEGEQLLHSISGMRETQTSSLKRERWTYSEAEHRMTLRPRPVPQSGGDASEAEPGTQRIDEKATFVITPSSSSPPPPLPVKAEATGTRFLNSGHKTESYCCWSVSDIIESGLQDSQSHECLLGMLSSTPHPFKGIDPDRLSAFVSALAKPLPCETSSKDVVPTEVSVEVMERAVACCVCVSHSSFDLSLLAEDTVDHLITTLGAVVRRVARWCTGYVSGEVNTSVELRCLRAILRCFAVIVCDMRVNICLLGDLLRLEDICFQSLFVVSNSCGRHEATNYASYVMSHAVHLYYCLWNRLESQREVTIERFFLRLPISDNMQLRLHLLPSGVNVMILTVTLVAAAQSTPISTDTITRKDVERLQQQCRVWVELFFQHFIILEREEKKERDVCSVIVLQFCEDLAHMVGLPEYPAADILLRFLFTTFIQSCFRGSPADGAASTGVEELQTLFVDAVFRVSYVLFSALQHDLNLSHLPESGPLSPAQLEQWHALTQTGKVAHDEVLQLSGVNMHRAVLYMALSRSVSDPALDAAFTSLHTRAAHVLTWALHDMQIPENSLDPLLRTLQIADGGLALKWDVLNAYSGHISAGQEKSMLSSKARERLLLWLLSVFRVREDQEGPGLEVARQRAIGHVAKLTTLWPPLLETIWPIAHRCVRDENSRVREAIVPLLLTLLSETCKGVGFTDSRKEDVVINVISSLLHLLSDRSITVVSRAIAALDTLLSDLQFKKVLDTTLRGESLLTFTQSKLLLATMAKEKEGRNQTDVMRVFLHHWVRMNPGEIAAHHSHARTARDLMRLTIANMTYPYEVSESFHLVALLRGMYRMVETHETLRRKTKRAETNIQELHGVMVGAVKVLWEEHQRLTPAPEAAAAMAVIHIMAMACNEWVEPLLEVLVQALVQQQQQKQQSLASSSPSTCVDAEAVGVTLLHVCRILRTVLLAPRLPSFSLDHLAQALTGLLSRYVGPHQQHILLSATGVLSAAITCGTDKFSNQVNTKYLLLCYSLMNTYYVRTLALLPSLRTDPHSVAYTLRFLFLLSEFLRLYPGWKHYQHKLMEDSAAGGCVVSNQLARGDGICANVYGAVEQVLQHCPEDGQKKTAVIALRVLGSLCILQPAIFFHRCKLYIHRALEITGDTSLQTQGLFLIRDFLKDEDARIDCAASMNAPVPTLSDTSSPCSTPSTKGKKKTVRGGKRTTDSHGAEFRLQASPCVEEQNSGMATWVMQEFHIEVLQLCESPSVQVRQLGFEVLRLCAQGGLLPPSKYISTLISLAADPQSEEMQQIARECLATHNERYADIVASNAAIGVVKTFGLHVACEVDVLHSVVLTHAEMQVGHCCVHTHLFLLLRKRHRDAFVSSLLRYFYQEGRAMQWLRDHNKKCASSNSLLFLGHLAVVLAYISYPLESDVLHVLDGCSAAVDLTGQNCLDFVQAQLKLLLQNKNMPRNSSWRDGAATPAADNDSDAKDIAIDLWKCFGIFCITQLSEFLRQEYNLHSTKLRRIAMRRSGSLHHAVNTAHRKTRIITSRVFQEKISALLRALAPLCDTKNSESSARYRAFEELHIALSRALQGEAKALGVSGGAQTKTKARTVPSALSCRGSRGRRLSRTLEEESNDSNSTCNSSSDDDHGSSVSNRDGTDSSDIE